MKKKTITINLVSKISDKTEKEQEEEEKQSERLVMSEYN